MFFFISYENFKSGCSVMLSILNFLGTGLGYIQHQCDWKM